MSNCKLCDAGFPLVDGNHIPTQSLGKIPVTRCANAPVLKTATQVLQEQQNKRKHLVPSAGWWFKRARLFSGDSAVFDMEQAYNHVENALAAAVECLHKFQEAAKDDTKMPGALRATDEFLKMLS